MDAERFMLRKYYGHSGGRMIHILALVETVMYGQCLIAEEAPGGAIIPIGTDVDSTIGWKEVVKEEWMKNFSNKKR